MRGIEAGLAVLALVSVVLVGCFRTPAAVPAKTDAGAAVPAVAAQRFAAAGSGTNLPITRKLAEAYSRNTGVVWEIPNSIGSDGALKAVTEGALELGLISRELTAEERAAGLKSVTYASVAVVFAAHASVPDSGVSIVDVLKIYQGQKTTWSDGSRIVVLVRPRNDSSNLVLFNAIPGFAALIDAALAENRWPVMLHDADMAANLDKKPGTFGYTDSSEVKSRPGIKVFSVDGIAMTAESVRTGQYPFKKTLGFVYREPLRGQAQAFVEFAFSPEGREIIANSGGIPESR